MEPNWRRAERLLEQLAEMLHGFHSLGWVWRDCKPANLICHKGRLWALDFEGACRIEQTETIPWGSPAYSRPTDHRTFARRPGTGEDDYAAGVIGFLFATGVLPPAARGPRFRLLKQSGCSPALRDRIETQLASDGCLAGRSAE